MKGGSMRGCCPQQRAAMKKVHEAGCHEEGCHEGPPVG